MGSMISGPVGIGRNHKTLLGNLLDPAGLASAPDKPADPVAPPPAPTADNSQGEMNVAAQQEALALQRGRAATILTGGGGLNGSGGASSTLLGQ